MPIIDRRAKLKARRALRKQRRQVEAVTAAADDSIDRHFMRRFTRLFAVRRFVAIWVLLVLMLGFGALWQVRGMDKFYLETEPVEGGVYREGILGSFTNSNPIYATSAVDAAVSRLIYSGLFTVDTNGKVLGDLASKLTVDDEGKEYTVNLRTNVFWHDGEQFDADDVTFTYRTIQNEQARSPQRSSWQGVKVTKTDQFTVVFSIPNALSSFKYALTNGIVPEHILGSVPLADLRSSNFNTVKAIGTGPYVMNTLEVVGQDIETRQERIALNKNTTFYKSSDGPNGVVIRSYKTEESLLKDFKEQAIQSMVGLSSVPDDLIDDEDIKLVTAPYTSSVMSFFNISTNGLNDQKVRQALVQSVDISEIRSSLPYSAVAVDSPFLKSHFAYDPELVQLPFDIAKATALLEEAGWIKNESGIREKEGKELSFRLVSQSLSEYAAITQKLQKAWSEIGVEVEVILQPDEDIQSGAIARHDYDILLYGIAIGYDPDVFAYWHSSQSDPNAQSRLNLSEYSNEIADEALEAGRTRLDETLRKVKYKPFLDQWRNDAPALAIYQPRFAMVVRGTFEGFSSGQLATATDRFYSIGDWKIRNEQVIKESNDN